MTSTLDLTTITLDDGAHDSRTDGVCLMEAVAWYAGEDHGDMPACVSPVLRRYGISLNDRLPQERRQELKAFIPRLVGTASDGLDGTRRALASRTLITEWLPAWLRLAKLDDLAVQAEAGSGLTGTELTDALRAIRDLTWKARQESRQALKVKIEAELRERWKDRADAAAAADAVADAAAVAVADAVAVAVAAAAAVADAVAVAVAVAAAAAAADAVAVADADAVAVAAAVAAADPWGSTYSAVYKAMRAHYETSDTFAAVRALRDTQLDASIELYDRLISPVRP